MKSNPASLDRQKRLLQSLGFGFVEEAPDLENHAAAPSAPRAQTPPRRREPAARPSPARPAKPPLSQAQALSRAEREQALRDLSLKVADCTQCNLQFSRNIPLAGGGNPEAELFVALEMPSAADDESGELATGELGELLDNILNAIKTSREEVFLTPAVKCHPLRARQPQRDEIQACHPYLERQVEIVRPQKILCFGHAGLAALLPEKAHEAIARVRGKWFDYRGVPLMTTFSLSYMNRNRERKKTAWRDLQELMKANNN